MQKNYNDHTEKDKERRDQTFVPTQCSSPVELPMAKSNQKSSEIPQILINQQSNDEFDQSCPICFEIFGNDHCRKTFTPCGHSFCEICLQRIIQLKPFCPLCRQQLHKDKLDDQNSEPIQLEENIPWDPQVVRAFYSQEMNDEDGGPARFVRLSNGETTNIRVGRGVKINISNDCNLIINGKRVQNPSNCNQQ